MEKKKSPKTGKKEASIIDKMIMSKEGERLSEAILEYNRVYGDALTIGILEVLKLTFQESLLLEKMFIDKNTKLLWRHTLGLED